MIMTLTVLIISKAVHFVTVFFFVWDVCIVFGRYCLMN
jgi:hypothetical protein